MSDSIEDRLWKAAKAARKNAHAPYSKYEVGAAVLCGEKIYSGCNVENSSFGGTICAEQVAIVKAISEGHKKIDALLVLTNRPAAPCGICRQVISEFAEPDMPLWMSSEDKLEKAVRFDQISPQSFRPEDLK